MTWYLVKHRGNFTFTFFFNVLSSSYVYTFKTRSALDAKHTALQENVQRLITSPLRYGGISHTN